MMSKFAEQGHCFVPFEELTKKTTEILEIEEPTVVMTFDHLVHTKELFKEDGEKIYLPPFFLLRGRLGKKNSSNLCQRNCQPN
jgi:hypothetical protein